MGRDWLKQRSSVPPGSSVHVYYNRIRNYSTSCEVQPRLETVQLCNSFGSNHWKFTGSYGQSIRQCICRAKASTHACSVQTWSIMKSSLLNFLSFLLSCSWWNGYEAIRIRRQGLSFLFVYS